MRVLGLRAFLLLALLSFTQELEGKTTKEECAEGLALHGRGQWSAALQVFASAVGNAMKKGLGVRATGKKSKGADLGVVVDCVQGAGLSLNVLGHKDEALSAFRLSQRLLALHAEGPVAMSEENMDQCRQIAETKSSDPLLSCNTVRALADKLHDALDGVNCRFHPSAVSEGDVVYVNALLLDDFMVNKHPFILTNYTLVTHCSDAEAPGNHEAALEDPKLINWFAQNPDLSSHPKLQPLPIGVANKEWPHGDIQAILTARERSERSFSAKTGWLYLNVNPETSADRKRALEILGNKNFVTHGSRGSFDSYLQDLSQHRFTLSPAGNGLDTHRTWESLLMGSVPVVASSPLDPLLVNLPVVIVDDWDEVTFELLQNAWSQIQERGFDAFNNPRLFADYWQKAFRGVAGI